ncbi:iron transporter [Halalkalicoccus ordinarius]|uniref:iron transporter n=1 Tax=Halalkalicoccus ordinarius TaxID=3116651 RepID=UPI00300F444A
MQRRDALRSAMALLGGASLAGCLDALGSDSAWRDLVVDRPDEIYVPPKTDGMAVWGSVSTDAYSVVLSATRPHRFWTVTGTETNQIAMRDAHSAHLMVSVRESDTRRLLPAEVSISIDRSDERSVDRTLWPMLSQRMGVHYGDNVSLPAAGSYRATIRVVPRDVEYRGGFEGGFEPASLEVGFEYDPEEIEALDRTILEESRRGRPGAVEPMDRDDDDHGDSDDHPPVPTAPSPDALPTVIDATVANDYAIVVATASHESGRYLVVSPRTRYNGYPLPFCSLSAAIDREGTGIESVTLDEATHPAFGHHYGAVVDPFSRSELTVAVETPPQLTRHEGYETAFFDRPEISPRASR